MEIDINDIAENLKKYDELVNNILYMSDSLEEIKKEFGTTLESYVQQLRDIIESEVQG